MNPKYLRVLAMMTVLGTLASFVVADAQDADSRTISFDAPGAGTASGQGTGCFGCTFAINIWGVAAGTYLDASNVYHGFVRGADGKFATFEAPDADTTAGSYNGTVAQSINDFGEVSGYYVDANGAAHGFVRSPRGAFTTFDAIEGGFETIPVSINDEGATSGYVFDPGSNLFRAFVRYSNGTLVVFVGPGSCPLGFNETPNPCYGNEATYVTLLGASVGNFEDGNLVGHGMIRSPGGIVSEFDAPSAGNGPYQGTGCPGCNMGVSHFGAIAGSYTDTNNVGHGFLRTTDGRFTTFDVTGAGSLPYQGTGCFSDCPMSLNDSGEITGSYFDSNYVQHGFLRTPDGRFVSIDPQGSVGTQPESINESGAITGYYVDENGVYHGLLRRDSGY